MSTARAAGSRLTRALFGLSDFVASLVLVFAVLGMVLAPMVLTQPRVNGTEPLTHVEGLLVAADCALLALGAWFTGRRRITGLLVLMVAAAVALLLPAAGVLLLALVLMAIFALPLFCAWRELRGQRGAAPESTAPRRAPD
ncbi:hypothetical protein [Pseudoxanthomonas sp.]|uniref:hypothetical protein n=1 Tax=Pseudoxanthomonas sp. TaxID=1871049 RepID=UPI0026165724|nr:hypothetical protein [Pseudoxanthomonas sp.]WDS35230.1 MAG: hypothetical protein O8I58_12795 [Pseudoxanthomonas sp.]